MRILLVVHYFLPHIGGMEEIVKKQAESLTSMGHTVTLITCRPDQTSPLKEKRDGYTIKRFRALNSIETKFGVTFPIISPFVFFALLREVARHDIIHLHDVFYMSSHMAALAAIIRKKRFYVTQHVAVVDHPSKVVMLIERIMYTTFGKMIFRHAERIVCYNTNVKDLVLSCGILPSKLLLTYNGIDGDYFAPVSIHKKKELRQKYTLPADIPIVLFVGRLVAKKGYDIVFDARSNHYLTIIVGDGNVPARMKQHDNVVLFGSATQEQLRDLYRLSDVFVFPAIGEILTLVMQEAMASGLPIITTNDPAYRQYNIDDTLVKFVERSAHAVKASIEQVISDPSLYERMSAYSRKIAIERFQWRTNYNNEYAIYEEMR